MIPSVIQIMVSIFCAVVSGIVLWKIQENKKQDEARYRANVEAAVKDRELQLANAEVTELLARKIDGEGINGELHAAAERLTKRREAVERHTHTAYFEYKERT